MKKLKLTMKTLTNIKEKNTVKGTKTMFTNLTQKYQEIVMVPSADSLPILMQLISMYITYRNVHIFYLKPLVLEI